VSSLDARRRRIIAIHNPTCTHHLAGSMPVAVITAFLSLWVVCTEVVAETASRANAYKLGPGDQILINVFGEEDLGMDFRLNDSGILNYPFLGELQVEGLSVIDLEQRITRGLKGPYLINPEVNVSIKEYRPFFLHGEVKQPAGIPYQPGLTLQRAIVLAGGFTERASKTKITVIRADKASQQPESISLSDAVYPGDVITVPQSFF